MEWQDFIQHGENAVKRLIGLQETLTLEFKSDHPQNPILQKGELTTQGRKIIAKELSAFSNSAGGLLIFGVDCRTVDGVDEAQALVPIPYLERAETSVRAAASELLQPRHAHIEVLAIASSEDPTSGYIIVSVPRSERRPHRSEAKAQKEYFKRSGASAFAMEHYDIEDAFKRVSSPRLRLEFNFASHIKSGNTFKILMRFGVKNEGNVSAKSVTMQMWGHRQNILGVDASRSTTHVSQFNDRLTFSAPSGFVVHPDQARVLQELHLKLLRDSGGGLTFDRQPLIPGAITFHYSLGAENMRSVEGEFILSEAEIAAIHQATS